MKSEPTILGALELEDLFRHLFVCGATGFGKTRYVILPLLEQVLSLRADDTEKRAGALIFDVKGDMGAHVQAVMEAAGRKDEIIAIGRGGNAWFDPFVGLEHDSRTVAERLIEMVKSLHPESGGAQYDDFWSENNRRFMQVAVVLARARGLGELGGMQGIAQAVSSICSLRCLDDDEEGDKKELLRHLHVARQGNFLPAQEIEMALRYLQTEAGGLASNTWSVITNYAQAYVSCITDSKLAGILTPSTGHKLMAEDVIDHGRVVLVSLSRVHFGPAAEVYRNLIKTAFQTCALQRHSRQYFDGKAVRPINSSRPVLFVADEFPSLVTPGSTDDGDAFFLDKCREVRVACVLSAQGMSALTARMCSTARTSHLLNNCCTKIFMGSDCPETLQYFEMAMPEGGAEEEDVVHGRVAAPPSFRLPNYEFGPPQLWISKSKSASQSKKPKFTPAVLRQLKTGEAIVLRPQGFAERMTFPAFKTNEI